MMPCAYKSLSVQCKLVVPRNKLARRKVVELVGASSLFVSEFEVIGMLW